MVYFDGSIYEGYWEQGNKNGQGRHVYENGDIYVGEYNDGKRSGRGRMYYIAKQEIYDGEWSNDRRQGEGTILNAKGEIASGDFRADQMEGKLQHQVTLSKAKTERVFSLIVNQRDAFISVGESQAALNVSRTSFPRLGTGTTFAGSAMGARSGANKSKSG